MNEQKNKHKKRMKTMTLLLLMLVCIFGNSFSAMARANACQNCSNGSYRCTKTEYVWKETGTTKTCDD